jgi:hypothetical protein
MLDEFSMLRQAVERPSQCQRGSNRVAADDPAAVYAFPWFGWSDEIFDSGRSDRP